ncbi:LysR family transcriptional regulator [Qingshengfaniella alkalisoli]|uniref:LysR family transcriptional regulator n=1 Tax=Qingshengfaniella alkalisoli TaxID=2599296 RepID=A0A5B8I6J0_9RHOB|nr:LysR family transcriptional regulator [Qingshengfaniella alkalisoli]QDY69049.1 LysR family transcriptional regulator [Qingshengfaniella alkalisoli]
MPVTLRQLRYLQALAETGSFGAAAERMHVSQPALSMQMKELETSLAATLVERRTGGVRLTAAGQDALRRALSILADVADLEGAARRGVLGAKLRLGIIPTVAPYFIPHLGGQGGQGGLPRMLRGMALTEAPAGSLLHGLRAGDLDVAVMSLPQASGDLHAAALFEDPLFIAGQPHHPAVSDRSTLEPHDLLTLGADHCLTDQAHAALGIAEQPTTSAASLSSLCRLAGQGLGVTILPQIALATEQAATPGLVVQPLAGASRQIGVVRIATDQAEMWFSELAHILSQAGQSALAASNPKGIEKQAS